MQTQTVGWTVVGTKKKQREPVVIPDNVIQTMTGPERSVLLLLQKAKRPVTCFEIRMKLSMGVSEQMVGDVLYGDNGTHKTLCNYVERIKSPKGTKRSKTWRLKRE
jgi:hypothetical protein